MEHIAVTFSDLRKFNDAVPEYAKDGWKMHSWHLNTGDGIVAMFERQMKQLKRTTYYEDEAGHKVPIEPEAQPGDAAAAHYYDQTATGKVPLT
jgi:hypothetical protein